MFRVSMALAKVQRPGKPIPGQASYGFLGKSPDFLKPESAAEKGCSKVSTKQSHHH